MAEVLLCIHTDICSSGKNIDFYTVLTQPYLKRVRMKCECVQLKEGVSAGEYSAIVDKCREAVAGGHGLSLATVIHFARS